MATLASGQPDLKDQKHLSINYGGLGKWDNLWDWDKIGALCQYDQKKKDVPCPSHKEDEIGPFKIILKNENKSLEFEGTSNEKTYLWTQQVPIGKYEGNIKTKHGLLPINKV